MDLRLDHPGLAAELARPVSRLLGAVGEPAAREDVQARRISDAYDELRKKGSFDGVVVNVEVEQAVKEVLALMDSR